jgi:hypothetical protein
MNQYQTPYNQYSEFGNEPVKQSNPLGLVGFILAFCVGPLGLLISLIALFNRPRGFAIAGVIVGLVTTTILAFIGFGIWMASGAVAAIMRIHTDYNMITTAVEQYKAANNGALPADIAQLGLSGGVPTDFWGNSWVIEPAQNSSGYQLVSAGPDKVFQTSDDILLAGGLNDEQVTEQLRGMIEQLLEESMNKRTGGSATPTPAPAPAPAADPAP